VVQEADDNVRRGCGTRRDADNLLQQWLVGWAA
jgi:hypothetical protein